MSKFYIILMAIIFSVTSCGRKYNHYNISPEVNVEIVNLDSIILTTPMINPQKLHVDNDYVICVNSNTKESLFQFWNRCTGLYYGATGTIGRGPDDIAFLNNSSCCFENDTLSLFEEYCYTTYRVEYGDSIPMIKRINRHSCESILANGYLKFRNGTQIIAFHNDDNVEFYSVKDGKSICESLFSYPKLYETRKIPSNNLGTAFHSYISKGPDSLFVAVYGKFPMISIQSIVTKSRNIYCLPEWDEDNVKYMNDNLITNKSCYHSVCSDKKYIYALYYGIKVNDGPIDPLSIKPEIHIWNWNGILERREKLSQPIMDITTDGKGTLYLLSPYKSNVIYLLKQ